MTFGTEALSSMKRLFIIIAAAAALALGGCAKEDICDIQSKTGHIDVKINAEMEPSTKTLISYTDGIYKIGWQPGDALTLFECAPAVTEYYWDSIREAYSQGLEEEDIVDGKAQFSFEIEERPGENAEYTYVSIFGFGYALYEDWSSSEDDAYIQWANSMDYEGEYVAPHMTLETGIESYQCPTPDSFDPSSDLMISKAQTFTEQISGEVSFSFARIGTILKITLTGLEDYKGKLITDVMVSCGESCNLSGRIIYDTVLEDYATLSYGGEGPMSKGDMGGGSGIRCFPMDVFVKEDGTADIWLRTLSGTVTDWFDIYLCIEEEETLAKHIDLAGTGKTIVLEEGGMSTFSAGGWMIADVEGVWDAQFKVNDQMDGFIATWSEVEHATGYECFLEAVSTEAITPMQASDNGDGTWSAAIESGLAPDNYLFYIKPIPEEGHWLTENIWSSHYFSVGLPQRWHFAHDAFSSNNIALIEGTEDEFIIDFSPGKVRFKNLAPAYDYAWQVLEAKGEWFMYSTEPFKKVHSIEIWSKDDSHNVINVYASKNPGEKTLLLEGEVVEVSEIDAGGGSYHYQHTHKKVRYTFPTDETYQYYMMDGTSAGILMTSQYSYIYYFE